MFICHSVYHISDRRYRYNGGRGVILSRKWYSMRVRVTLRLIPITKTIDSHSFFADPDPAVFLNADPDTALTVL